MGAALQAEARQAETEVAGALQLPRRDFIWKIGLPSAMPDILSGMRLPTSGTSIL